MYTGKRVIKDVWMHFAGFLGLVFFCLFFFCFFLLFYATWPCMLSVQCIISQTALHRATAVLSSAGQHRDIGPMSSCQWVGQRLQVRRTLIGQLWLKVLTWALSGSGSPAVRSLQSSKLTWNYKPPPPFTSSWTRQKIYRFIYTYTYACVCMYMCIYAYINN